MWKGQENHPNEERNKRNKKPWEKSVGAEREEVVWDGLL